MPHAAFRALPALALCVAAGGACARRNTVEDASEPPSHEETLAEPAVRAPRSEVLVGDATWYGARLAGHRTANGERFDPRQMTAAHRTLAFGTWVAVTCLDTGRTVRVRITDRGPFGHEERIIDLSRAAAEKLGIVHRGVARVELRIVDGP
jgi:rare lipoprotein A